MRIARSPALPAALLIAVGAAALLPAAASRPAGFDAPAPPRVIGPLHPIAEDDLLSVIETAALRWRDSGGRERAIAAARDKARAYLERPPRADKVTTATRASVRRIDPSVRLAADVLGPDGEIIFPRGALVNPLDYAPLEGSLLLFDGDDPAQVAFAERYSGSRDATGEAKRVRNILVGGPWLDLARKWGGPLYFDQAGALSARLGITEAPALVEQDGRSLVVRTFAPDSIDG